VSVKVIMFDASGTLLNDIYAVWKANSDAYAALGFEGPGTIEQFKKNFKLPAHEFHIESGIPPALLKEVDGKFREFYRKYASSVEIFPEVIDVLKELKQRGATLAVASNIPTLFLREHLRRFAIDKYLDTITGQEDCDEQKPSPKPLLFTVQKLGVRPQEAMYVGDMEEDIIAGKKAKTLTTAIVRNESYQPKWRLERQMPDYLITNLKELLSVCSN
jgi:pyrophosphatase PpaX